MDDREVLDRCWRHVQESEPRLSRIEERLEYHEKSCEMFRKITYSIASAIVAIFLAIGGELLLIDGRQQVVLATIPQIASQMTEIRSDIKENQRLLINHQLQFMKQNREDR